MNNNEKKVDFHFVFIDYKNAKENLFDCLSLIFNGKVMINFKITNKEMYTSIQISNLSQKRELYSIDFELSNSLTHFNCTYSINFFEKNLNTYCCLINSTTITYIDCYLQYGSTPIRRQASREVGLLILFFFPEKSTVSKLVVTSVEDIF